MATMMTWEELLACYENLPEPKPVFYRLYYDDQGRPITYSMEDLPGNYIEVDRETYVQGSTSVRVVKGRLIWLTLRHSEKLRPNEYGTPCHPQDVAIVDPTSTTFWSKHFYGEQN
jgi:hypothetical protein